LEIEPKKAIELLFDLEKQKAAFGPGVLTWIRALTPYLGLLGRCCPGYVNRSGLHYRGKSYRLEASHSQALHPGSPVVLTHGGPAPCTPLIFFPKLLDLFMPSAFGKPHGLFRLLTKWLFPKP